MYPTGHHKPDLCPAKPNTISHEQPLYTLSWLLNHLLPFLSVESVRKDLPTKHTPQSTAMPPSHLSRNTPSPPSRQNPPWVNTLCDTIALSLTTYLGVYLVYTAWTLLGSLLVKPLHHLPYPLIDNVWQFGAPLMSGLAAALLEILRCLFGAAGALSAVRRGRGGWMVGLW